MSFDRLIDLLKSQTQVTEASTGRPRHANGSFHSIERAAQMAIDAANKAAAGGGDSRALEITYRPKRVELAGASASEIADAHDDAARTHSAAANRSGNEDVKAAHMEAAREHAAAAKMKRSKG